MTKASLKIQRKIINKKSKKNKYIEKNRKDIKKKI